MVVAFSIHSFDITLTPSANKIVQKNPISFSSFIKKVDNLFMNVSPRSPSAWMYTASNSRKVDEHKVYISAPYHHIKPLCIIELSEPSNSPLLKSIGEIDYTTIDYLSDYHCSRSISQRIQASSIYITWIRPTSRTTFKLLLHAAASQATGSRLSWQWVRNNQCYILPCINISEPWWWRWEVMVPQSSCHPVCQRSKRYSHDSRGIYQLFVSR